MIIALEQHQEATGVELEVSWAHYAKTARNSQNKNTATPYLIHPISSWRQFREALLQLICAIGVVRASLQPLRD